MVFFGASCIASSGAFIVSGTGNSLNWRAPAAQSAPGGRWQLACAIRVGNSSGEREVFFAAARTWGRRCRWFVALTLPGDDHHALAMSLANYSWARTETIVLPLSQAAATNQEPFALLEVLRVAFVQGVFGQGFLDAACAMPRPSLFVVPENVAAELGSNLGGTNPGANPATLFCGRRLTCQTRAAMAQLRSGSMRQPLRRPTGCGVDLATHCAMGVTRPVAIHSARVKDVQALYTRLYRGWPTRCTVPLTPSGLPRRVVRPRVAVLIGSLLRAPDTSLVLLTRLFADPSVEYSIFVYTSPLQEDSVGCLDAVNILRGVAGAEVRFSTPEEVLEEQRFEAVTASRHMRQWYKLQRAFEMMQAREERVGRQFDIVLKTRTDVDLGGPLSLEDFPELLVGRVLYGLMDIVFICRRDVARLLLSGIVRQLMSRAGDQHVLRPLRYERIERGLREGADYSGLLVQNFPDIGCETFRQAVLRDGVGHLRAAIAKRRASFEAAHHEAATGVAPPTISAHWRFTGKQKWDRKEMCSITHWYYHMHVAEPEVSMRGWPTHVGLSKIRHYRQCNCEPPHCIPNGFPLPWPVFDHVDYKLT